MSDMRNMRQTLWLVPNVLESTRASAPTRERLLRRDEADARVFANSEGTAKPLRLGRVYGLLEAGVIVGCWRPRAEEAGMLTWAGICMRLGSRPET
jgi:hypothetical protein